MSFLHAFSKILIFKDSTKTQYYFGGSNRTPGVGTVQNLTPQESGESKKRSVIFNSVYPTVNFENFLPGSPGYTADPTFMQENLLHAIGTEDSIINNIYATSELAGTAFFKNDKFVYSSIPLGSITYPNVANSDGLSLVSPAPSNGNTARTIDNNKIYTFASGAGTWTHTSYYTNITPSTINPALSEGDYLYYGPAGESDPNNLKVAGKIKTVYGSGDTAYTADKKLFELEKPINNTSSETAGAYSDLYYYKASWNGVNTSVDISSGFYVLISVDESDGFRQIFPWLGPGPTADDSILNNTTANNYSNYTAFTDLIKIKRISKKYKADEYEDGEDIPCTIFRTNTFDIYPGNSTSTSQIPSFVAQGVPLAFQDGYGDVPCWCAYFVNPYGNGNTKLLKNTAYKIEINELLPAIDIGHNYPIALGYAYSGAI
jgi:hypothetical protein